MRKYYTDAFSLKKLTFIKGTKASNLVQDIIYEVLDEKIKEKRNLSFTSRAIFTPGIDDLFPSAGK